jgi:hypothetical protein
MLPAPVSSGDCGGSDKVRFRQLLEMLSHEYVALQQKHDDLLAQLDCSRQCTEVDIDAVDIRSSANWPVVTFDDDTGCDCSLQAKPDAAVLGSIMTLMQQCDARKLEAIEEGRQLSPRASSPITIDNLDIGKSLHANDAQEKSMRCLDTTPMRVQNQNPRVCDTPQSKESIDSRRSGSARSTPRSTASSAGAGLKRFSKKFGAGGSTISLGAAEGGCFGRLRQRMRLIHISPWFETVFAFFILMNAIVMCVEFQYSGDKLGHEIEFKGWSKHHGSEWTRPDLEGVIHEIFSILEWIFGMTFAFELMFKVAVLKIRLFKDIWNWIDIATVGFFFLEKVFGSFMPVGSQWIRICRLARLSRLIKLVRTVEGFDHLYLMTTAIKGSVRILAWALALLGLIQLTIGLVVGQVLQVTYFEDDTKSTPMQHEIYKYFGTCSRSLLSMFEITLANWPPICRLLSEEVTEWFMVLCVIHKLTIGFAVVGVINGVFMQETFKVASSDDVIMVRQKAKAMQRHRKNMQELFNGLDNSGDGKVNLKEFRQLANFPSVQAWLASMDIRTEDLDTMFHLMDGDRSGGINFQEMLSGMEQLKGQARSVDLFALMNEQKALIKHLSGLEKELCSLRLGEGSPETQPSTKPPSPKDVILEH